jgi:hypothetical protein
MACYMFGFEFWRAYKREVLPNVEFHSPPTNSPLEPTLTVACFVMHSFELVTADDFTYIHRRCQPSANPTVFHLVRIVGFEVLSYALPFSRSKLYVDLGVIDVRLEPQLSSVHTSEPAREGENVL